MRKKPFVPRLVILLFGVLVAFSFSGEAASNGIWITGDFHTHTFLTDGSHTETDVVSHAFDTYNLDWMANSEHGGAFNRDINGSFWEDATPTLYFLGNPGKDKDNHALMWRWQSLRDYSSPLIANLQLRYPKQTLIQALEWNVPSHEHASVGILMAESTSISDFEYRFDASDKDVSRAKEGLIKHNSSHADALTAAAYLQKNYPDSSYLLFNHPSRKQKYSIADIRDFNNVAPTVCFGFEGLPGHQKESARGGYDANLGGNTYRARTYGGADYMVAKVGGLWDSLLGEKRKFWVFVNSDFHSAAADADFYPGEYAKTYAFAKDKRPLSIIAALRSGNSFAVHGDLINALDFTAATKQSRVLMGGELPVKKGSNAELVIRFKSPEKNNNGDTPVVNRIDLISGDVTGKIAPSDFRYKKETNESTRVLATFTSKDWTIDADGYYKIVYQLSNIGKDQYFRLRGTNLAAGVDNETDAAGNPLIDDLAKNRGLDNAPEAYADLWFYSNPIFISVTK